MLIGICPLFGQESRLKNQRFFNREFVLGTQIRRLRKEHDYSYGKIYS